MRMELLHLLLGDLDLLQTGGDLVEGEKATLLPLGDEVAKLLELRNRRLIAKHDDCLVGHSPETPFNAGFERPYRALPSMDLPLETVPVETAD